MLCSFTMKSFAQQLWFLLLVVGFFGKSLTNGETLRHMGCFDLDYALSMNYHRHILYITLNKCVTLCQYRNTKYAGVEQSDDYCYCGGDIAEASIKRNGTLCKDICRDESTAVCGGEWLMSVYMISDFNPGNSTDVTPTDRMEELGFLVGGSVGVTMHNYSTLNTYDTIMTTVDWAYSVDYHYAKNLAFAFVKSRIFKSTMGGKVSLSSASSSVVREVSKCDGFAVDWVNDRLYWSNCDLEGVTIMSCDYYGLNVALVLKRPGEPVNIKNMNIDPYEKIVFWTGDGVIESCTFSGNSFQTNMSNPETPVRSLTLDLTARRVYYTSTNSLGSALHSMDYAGSTPLEHFRTYQLRSVYGLGVFREYVYWVNFASSRDIIYQAPLNLTITGEVKMLKTIDRAVWQMKLVHPELQTLPGPNPCIANGCSHHCIVVSLSARCLCPQGLTLDDKGKTCLNSMQDSHETITTTMKTSWSDASSNDTSSASQARLHPRTDHHANMLLVVCSVGALFMIVLGLLYFANHHWSSIQAQLSRVPYIRQEQHSERRVNPQYDITQDNVNLI